MIELLIAINTVFHTAHPPPKPVGPLKVVKSVKPRWLTFTATAYTADCEGCIGITKTGIDVRNTIYHENKRVIAVDPRVIPLGTTLEIRLADGTTFDAIAVDTGGAIKGARIDVLVEKKEDALEFGRQDVKVRILKEESK